MGQQQQIMREQDEQLSLVGKSIGRLKEIGTLIGWFGYSFLRLYVLFMLLARVFVRMFSHDVLFG